MHACMHACIAISQQGKMGRYRSEYSNPPSMYSCIEIGRLIGNTESRADNHSCDSRLIEYPTRRNIRNCDLLVMNTPPPHAAAFVQTMKEFCCVVFCCVLCLFNKVAARDY